MTTSTPRIDRRSPHRGAVLIVVLLVAALLALGVGSYLALNLSTARLARHTHQQNAAFQLAEAGGEEALWSFNQAHAHAPSAWADWTAEGGAAWRKFTGFDLGAGATGTIKVYVSNTQPGGRDRPTVAALATVSSPNLPPATRLIELTLARRSFFASGIVAQDLLKFAGNNVSVDSWNSDPDDDPATAPVPYSAAVRNDQGRVATLAVQSSALLVNQANIWGSVATGGAPPEVGPNGSIRGRNTPDGVAIDPARVTTDFSASLDPVEAPLDGTAVAAIGSTLGVAGQATQWRCERLRLQGNDTLTILGDVTLVLTATTGDALSVTGQATIVIPDGSSLTLYVGSDLKIAGRGLANANIRPGTCRLYGTAAAADGQVVEVAGNGALSAVIYAPHAAVQINGNGDVLGAVVGQSITFTGNAQFHYDESLAAPDDAAPFGVVRWAELNTPADRDRWAAAFANW